MGDELNSTEENQENDLTQPTNDSSVEDSNTEEQTDRAADKPIEEPTSPPAAENDAASEAINKFKGELSKIKGDDSSGEEKKGKKRGSYNKGDRPAKRPKQRISHYVRETPTPSSTFVMKLFDRSIDLTQFTEYTPLYPICRSWFMNNPKSMPGKRESKKREDRGSSRDTYTLPQPLPAVGELAPSPVLTPYPLSQDFELDYDPDIPLPSREELLQEHFVNWTKVKRFHNNESAKRERRYKPSLSILRDLYCSRLV